MEIGRKLLLYVLVAVFVMALCAGCSVSLRPYPNPDNPISRVAVLPLHNKTENVTGCEFVRHAFIDLVKAHYYSVMPPGETDQILQDKFGITLGGQLDLSNPGIGAPSPQVMGEALGVDGVFYGTLEEFNHIYLMYYEDRRVEVTFIFINSKTGLTVWEKEAQASNTYSLNRLLNPYAQGLGGMLMSRALGQNPLKEETDEVMRKLGETLPCGPGYVR